MKDERTPWTACFHYCARGVPLFCTQVWSKVHRYKCLIGVAPRERSPESRSRHQQLTIRPRSNLVRQRVCSKVAEGRHVVRAVLEVNGNVQRETGKGVENESVSSICSPHNAIGVDSRGDDKSTVFAPIVYLQTVMPRNNCRPGAVLIEFVRLIQMTHPNVIRLSGSGSVGRRRERGCPDVTEACNRVRSIGVTPSVTGSQQDRVRVRFVSQSPANLSSWRDAHARATVYKVEPLAILHLRRTGIVIDILKWSQTLPYYAVAQPSLGCGRHAPCRGR
ncbi:hypothetical protein C8F04DRAFT_1093403 [Mycena alexandri]|uniref:Uncharacterized protein n=1 Tax=Mycena alexandri TaxID=1745969 RepID=A0AAD6T353_9AGAR|nr:hypothetical protein C8F04DRAFT_1093403 [Mycena alexandri]